MNYVLTRPCDQCPFIKSMQHGFTLRRLKELASGEFPCHKTASEDEDTGYFEADMNSAHCAGALIFHEKRGTPTQMMRISERLGLYDRRKLDKRAFRIVR